MTRALPRNLGQILFWAAVVLVGICQLWIVVQGIFFMRLWEDEAFNLTVPLNLLDGLGYTSDGALGGSELTPFDPRISTGPTVLLPIAALVGLGADPVIGGRLIILIYYAALLVGLGRVGWRITGRWGALVAVTIPLGWNTWASGSPIQSPVDILGEVPAAALLVWAFIVAQRRPWLTGLLIGVAMQTKILAGLAAPALALAVLLLSHGTWLRRIGRVILCAAVAVIPNALYELWKLVALGPHAYWANLRDYYWFFKTGGEQVEAVSPVDKFALLANGWFSPGWLTALGFLVIIVAIVIAITRAGEERVGSLEARAAFCDRRRLRVYALVSVTGLALWVGWWALSEHSPLWPRYIAIPIYVFVPVLGAIAVHGIQTLARSNTNGRRESMSGPAAGRVGVSRLSQLVAGALTVALALVVGTQLWGHLTVSAVSRGGETLAEQRVTAASLAELGHDMLVTEWGRNVPIIVLSGTRIGLNDVPAYADVPELVHVAEAEDQGRREALATLGDECAAIEAVSSEYVVCVPKTAG